MDTKHAQDHISNLKMELIALVDEKLREISEVANEAGISVSFYDAQPLENIYLVNAQFMDEWHWEESDLESRDIEMGDWITSGQMDY